MTMSIENRPNAHNYAILESKLQEVKDEQGFLGKTWNGIKEFTNLGVSYSDCESMLEKYQNGEVDMDEAIEYIESFENKQETMTELGKNIVTGTVAIAATVGTAGLGSILLTGAALGAGTKVGVGMLDRATNEVDNDVLDTKEILKDGISGAVTGVASALPSSEFGNVTKGITDKTAKKVATQAVCCATCGAVSGSTSYLTNVALDEDKTFNFGDLTKATLTSTVVSGVVGAGVGGFLSGTKVGESVNSYLKDAGKAVQDSTLSATRKVLGTEVKEAAKKIA